MSTPFSFKKILIANRGEIAIRIARACFELKITTVGIYSYEDRYSLHRYKTDESYKIGEIGGPLKAYLDFEEIIRIAKKTGVDGIHPGYGFLSENGEFARRCAEEGIVFIGPAPETLDAFGLKTKAKKVAQEAGLQVIPGGLEIVHSLEEAKRQAREAGYPITLKSVAGGGGRGIRMVSSPKELTQVYDLASSEAMSSFGSADLFLEKKIVRPRHIEIQILCDHHGHKVHLFERDCSIQRRNQKVVEIATSQSLKSTTLERLYEDSLRLARHVNYVGLGTIEFLVDQDERAYFLEVNPRVQVEHTVTEMITGIDLIQASILVASGHPLDHPYLGITSQDRIVKRGIAIQCRITTENPLQDFAPDTGTIIAYRPAAGFGIRLDEGHGTSGGKVTPYFDSLLVKVTAWGQDLPLAAAKMHRALSEFRIRGVKHNIPLLKKIVCHPAFLKGDLATDFFQAHPELFVYKPSKDRATKMLRYLAQVTINNIHGIPEGNSYPLEEPAPLDVKSVLRPPSTGLTAKEVFDKEGASGLVRWIHKSKVPLFTDTTMRDAHQSLFATRLRTKDILKACEFYRVHGRDFFSLEVWGGATFDTCLRFLKEDPWERLAKIREAIPNVLLQMLLRGDNAVGYTNYPSWVVKDFIKETVQTGLDLFRIFDCLNQPSKMALAIEEVKKQGGIAEACICYTGDITDPKKTKYTLSYYLDLAKKLEEMGADIICIKDMAGLLRPQAAGVFMKALKEAVGTPLHFHNHDSSGAGVTSLYQGIVHGCDIVDGAVSSMSGLTSQPSLNALVASLDHETGQKTLSLEVLDQLSHFWRQVRQMYSCFDPGLRSTSTDVYFHEIPGGQYSNLFNQAEKVGLSAQEFQNLTHRYKEVNDLLGDIIKVTPSSKVVGDFALLLQKSGITGPELIKDKVSLDYPDSVMSFFKGEMGEPYGGFPKEMKDLVLGTLPKNKKENDQTKNIDSYQQAKKEAEALFNRPMNSSQVLSYRLYPKVYKEYLDYKDQFGKVTNLSTPHFFFGVEQGKEVEVDIEEGKTLYLSLEGVSDCDEKGNRSVFFKLNGFNRIIDIKDESFSSSVQEKQKADLSDDRQVAATMPAKILELMVKVGDKVTKGETLLVTEAMKMEYAVTAKRDGTVRSISISVGDLVEDGDLLIQLE